MPDDTVYFQLGDLGVTQPDFGEQLVVVLAEKRCGPQMEAIGSGGKPHRHGAVCHSIVDRVTDVLEEVAELQLRNVCLTMRLRPRPAAVCRSRVSPFLLVLRAE